MFGPGGQVARAEDLAVISARSVLFSPSVASQIVSVSSGRQREGS